MFIASMAVVYLVCGKPVLINVSRQVDGRSVSRAYILERPDTAISAWIEEGLKESREANEVFVVESVRDCVAV